MANKNEDKAHTMLNRWVAIKKDLNSRSHDKRPKHADECSNLQECSKWRAQVIQEITRKVSDIQNASLGEFKIRELNDEINKLFKEKYDWENRIKVLGGMDYQKLAPKVIDVEGIEVPDSGGYRYWGAAKELPGVRELFSTEVPTAPKKSITEIYKNIDREYYGGCFNDEMNTLILEEEKAEEERLMKLYKDSLNNNENGNGSNEINNEINDEINNDSPIKKRKIDNDTYIEMDTDKIELEQFENVHNFMVGKAGEIYIDNNNNEMEIENEILNKKKEELIKLFENKYH